MGRDALQSHRVCTNTFVATEFAYLLIPSFRNTNIICKALYLGQTGLRNSLRVWPESEVLCAASNSLPAVGEHATDICSLHG